MILVPVKNLNHAKQRLSAALAAEERTALARAMLEDVLDAIDAGRNGEAVGVVTSDRFAQELARRHSFDVIEDKQNQGETEAIEMATGEAMRRRAEFTLVFPGDIPLITPREVTTVLEAAPAQGCVLVPSRDRRGSNAVLRRPGGLFPLRFGNDSFLPHLASARMAGAEVVVLELAGIGLDIDEPDDLAGLMAVGESTRSQRLLKQWQIRERLGRELPRSANG